MYSAIVKPYYVLSLHTGPRSAVLCIIRIVLYYVLIRIMYCGTLNLLTPLCLVVALDELIAVSPSLSVMFTKHRYR